MHPHKIELSLNKADFPAYWAKGRKSDGSLAYRKSLKASIPEILMVLCTRSWIRREKSFSLSSVYWFPTTQKLQLEKIDWKIFWNIWKLELVKVEAFSFLHKFSAKKQEFSSCQKQGENWLGKNTEQQQQQTQQQQIYIYGIHISNLINKSFFFFFKVKRIWK